MEVLPYVLNPLLIGDAAPFDPLLVAHRRAPRQQPLGVRADWVPDSLLPGYDQKIAQLCRRFGKFRPQFVAIGQPSDLAEGLVTAANEGAIALTGSYLSRLEIPNVVMVPIVEKEATWDLFVVWQLGKTAGPLRALLDCLQSKPKSASA